MKKVFNKIGVYLLILFVVLISLIIIGVGYLFLVPKAELFGISYVKDKTYKYYSSVDYDIELIDKLIIKASKFNINIKASDEHDDIRIKVYNDFSGFSKNKKANEFIFEYNPSDDSLLLETKEMSGWIGSGDSRIDVFIPKALFGEAFSVSASAKSDCSIAVEGFGGAKLGSLEIGLNRGDFYYDNISINEIYIKSNRGEITAGENVSGEVETLTLDLGKNKVDFLYAGKAQEGLKKEGAEYEDIDFVVKKLILRNCEKNGEIRLIRCEKILSDEGCVVNGGKLTVSKCKFFDVESENFSMRCYNLDEAVTTSYFKASGTGSIVVDNAGSVCNLSTNSGDIKVEKANKELVVETMTGDISLNKASFGVTAITKSGNISVAFDEELGEYSIGNRVRVIDSLRSSGGTVKVIGVNKMNLDVSKADVYVEYYKVVDTNEVKTNDASAKIVVPKNEAVQLNCLGQNAKLKVEVGTTHYDEVLTGEYKPPVCFGTIADGELSVSAENGTLEIYSADLIK